MGAKGSQQVQQNSQYTPNPAITQAGGTALNMATKAAQSPFQQPAAPVAGFNQQQQQAFGQTGALQGFAQPYFDQASQFVNQSAAPITGQDVNQYYNPFAQNVFNAQNDLFGQQMQEATGNLTQAAGGVGADRIAVGQSELARQQQLARGQTAAGLYGQALSAAQQQKANEAQAGFAMGSFGPAAQNAQLQGTQALLGTGGLQQQQAQAQLNSPYQQQLAKLAFPYQNSQFLAGIAGGLAPGMGGFNSGNTTYPGASPWGTVAGLGTVGAGIYGLGNQQGWWGGGGNNSGDWVGQASGGRVSPFDAGGSVAFGDDPFKDLGATSIVPDIALKPGSGYHAPPQAAQQQQSGSGGFGMNDAIGLATKALPLLFAAADGGAVSPFSQGRGYDDGGNVDFGDRFGAAYAMTPQEQALYQRHLTNLNGPGGVDNADGSRSTLYQTSFTGDDGKTYNVPTVWDGKILPPHDAIGRAYQEGIEKFPAYGSGDEAEARYNAMHGYMDKDTADYMAKRKPRGYDDGGNVDFGDRFGAAYAPATFADRYSAAEPGMPATIDARWPSSPFALQRQPSPVQSANGAAPNLHFGNEAGVVQDAIKSGQFDPQGGNYTNFAGTAAVPALPSRSIPAVASDEPATEPMGATPGARLAQNDTGASPFTQNGMPPAPDFSASSPDESTTYAKSPYSALINAGLGMLAASGQRDARGLPLSPFAAIGKGGMEGIKTLEEQRSAAQKDKEIELRAKQLQEEATKVRSINPYQAAELQLKEQELARQNKALELQAHLPVKVGQDAFGRETYGVRGDDGKLHDPISGKPLNETMQNSLTPGTLMGDEPSTQDSERGDIFLQSLPPPVAAQVKAIAEGRQAFPSGMAASKPYWQQMLRLVQQYDPTAEQSTLPTRAAMRKDAATGQMAKNITSYNTALGHLDRYDRAIDKLGNRGSSLYNAATKDITLQTSQKYQEALAELRASKTALTEELTRAFRGSGGNVHDITEWAKSLDEDASPAYLHATAKAAVGLLASRIEAQGDQYKRGMGKSVDPDKFLTPKARQIFERIGGERLSDTLGATEKPQTERASGVNLETPPVPGAKKAGDGKWYAPDPKRPGKYLQVNP